MVEGLVGRIEVGKRLARKESKSRGCETWSGAAWSESELDLEILVCG